MERCGFFDANMVGDEYDRVYLANEFAAYFASFIGNGVFADKSDELQVLAMASPSMQITVKGGQGWINGYWYENTDDLYLPIDVADGVLNRIDIVVLRLGFAERAMWLEVKKGANAVTPIAPDLIRNADYYELKLAEIYVGAGAIKINQIDITDTRLDANVCGFVCGLITQFDTTAFGRQLQTFINDYIAQANEDYQPYLDTLENLKQLANTAYNQFLVYLDNLKTQGNSAYQDYLVWLGNLKVQTTADLQALLAELEGLISESVVAELNMRIDKLEKLNPTVEVANIQHDIGSYVQCLLYEFDYGAGVQLAGEGPAGGTGLTSTPVEYTMDDGNNIIVRTRSGYGTVDVVNKLDDTKYVVTFADSITCLLIVLKQ